MVLDFVNMKTLFGGKVLVFEANILPFESKNGRAVKETLTLT